MSAEVVTVERINSFDGRVVMATVAWPETNFDQPLHMVEGTGVDGLHVKVLARQIVEVTKPEPAPDKP